MSEMFFSGWESLLRTFVVGLQSAVARSSVSAHALVFETDGSFRLVPVGGSDDGSSLECVP